MQELDSGVWDMASCVELELDLNCGVHGAKKQLLEKYDLLMSP